MNSLNKKKSIKLLKKAKQKGLNSIGTINAYQVCTKLYLDWCDINGVPLDRRSSMMSLNAYLLEKSEIYQQKTIDQHRMALNFAYSKKLSFAKSLLDTVLNSREYTLKDVLLIIRNVHEKNALAIILCFVCGLRAHELCTIQRFDENRRTNTRSWSDELFTLMENYSIYHVTGKGGLIRRIAIPNEFTELLENYRLKNPKAVRDRKINYTMNYAIGYGQALSQCFSRSSNKILGYSTGLHGLRHSYVKNRIRTLVKNGIDYEAARLIISEEIGHFRPTIISCYMR